MVTISYETGCSCPPTHHTQDCPHYDPYEYLDNCDISQCPGDCDQIGHCFAQAPNEYRKADSMPSWTYKQDLEEWETVDEQGNIITIPSSSGNLPKTTEAGTTGSYSTSSRYSHWFKNCTHALQPFKLLDGTEILASAWMDRRHRDHEPDLACYMDQSWDPDTIAFSLPWQDYGLPYLSIEQVLTIARTLLTTARGGSEVEIGCVGGHGRTGTMLAILDLLSAPEGQANGVRAIRRVQSHYCSEAIETAGQRWYVTAVAATLNGTDIPPKPTPAPVTTVTSQTTTLSGFQSKVCKASDCHTTVFGHGMYKNDYCGSCQAKVSTAPNGKKTCYKHNGYIKDCQNCRASNGNFGRKYRRQQKKLEAQKRQTEQTRLQAIERAKEIDEEYPLIQYQCPRCGKEDTVREQSVKSVHGHFTLTPSTAHCDHCTGTFARWEFLPELTAVTSIDHIPDTDERQI